MNKILIAIFIFPFSVFAIGNETSSEWKETDKGLAEKIIKPKMDEALEKLEVEKKAKVRRRLEYQRKQEELKKKAPTFESCMKSASSCFASTKEKVLTEALRSGGFDGVDAILSKRCQKTTYYGINCIKEYRDNKLKKARRRYAP
jgi:hypothetical protein